MEPGFARGPQHAGSAFEEILYARDLHRVSVSFAGPLDLANVQGARSITGISPELTRRTEGQPAAATARVVRWTLQCSAFPWAFLPHTRHHREAGEYERTI